MPHAWAELRIAVTTEHADIVSNFLIEAGAPGVELRDHATGTEVIAYFSARPPIAALRVLLGDLGETPQDISTRQIEEESWAETWKHHCRPQIIGERLYVCPSWDAEETPPGRLTIIIDPGMAFGTGDHPSTRGCLRLTEAIATRGPLGRALDCGTGSGILAIAAVKLGATEVVAVDTDPLACAAARGNADLNGVHGRVHVADSLDACSPPFDVILANLYTDLLVEIAPHFRRLAAPSGILVCAGFLATDAVRIERAFLREGFQITAQLGEAGWVALELEGGSQPCPPRSF